ncbi:cytochrome p450 domain-containing protein [Trichoderma breve]|uniref:Cytochrome p450 domain-containing protein n=1 Tax=Trichoderma breve TaxID=2034170 RepID=A0A9W9JSX5_9HYPO|nr:cytochrome p450 domain-containing protein [Trichoderma breve]KAJ4865711.1 cytochrome p450 domain-containing protein [Trichoderma breve]
MGVPAVLGILNGFLTQTNLIGLAGLWIAYYILWALYNISPFHPLNHIPGPKLAAATFLYEAWYDLILHGRYTHEIKRMHEIYGPVVRINPEELHFDDIAFVDEIYAGGGRKRDKQQHFLNFVAGPIVSSMFATLDHDHHRIRRSAMNKFFSRAQILKLESNIRELVDQLCDKMIRLGKQNGDPLDVTTSYSCFTSDVISGYCFGEPFGFISQETWYPNFREPLGAILGTTYVFRFFPPLKILTNIAPLFAKYMREDIAKMLAESNERMPARVRKAKQEHESGKVQDRASIFAAILGSSLPDEEKTDYRLGGEGFSMISAGTETTAWTLTVITFYLLNQPEILERLTKELQDADAISLTWVALENLPYLSAVITEGLRLSYGVTARIPRIASKENLIYQGQFNGHEVKYVIPSGTPMGMSNAINHHNEEVFPDSNVFRPERWLDIEEAQRRRMESSLTSFSKGSRVCLGMNLAYCNLFLSVVALTLRVFPRTKLYETGIDDVKYDYDLFVPMPKKESKGVRVVIN